MIKTAVILTIGILMSTFPIHSQAPIAKKEQQELTIHKHTRVDDYFWMNQRDSEGVLAHLKAENEYTEKYFDGLKTLENKLLDEFENRINPNEESAPFRMNGKEYQIRNKEGKDYSFIDRKNESGEFDLFFDENQRAVKSKFYQLGDWTPSPDNNLLAFSEDYIGRRKYTIQIRDNKSGKFLNDEIKDTDGSIVWGNDNKTLYYVKKDEQTLREFQVWRHILGEDSKKDELVYEDLDERYYVYVGKSMTNEYIEIGSYSSLTSEMSFIRANDSKAKAELFLKRKEGHLYSVEHHADGFYVVSNDQASNKKIVFSEGFPESIEACEVVQEHDTNVLIENLLLFSTHMVVEERVKGISRLKLVNLSSGSSDYLSFKEEAYSLALGHNDEYEGTKVVFSYNSMSTPYSVFSYDFNKGERTLIHRKELIDPDFDSDNYTTKRVWAPANDGVLVPISIVYKKGIDLSKSPLLLYGYGSYGYTIPENFSPTRISLLDRGFVFALAHIRGGKYLGEEWYETGKFDKKKNTFTDFICSAEYLSRYAYCDPEKIYAQGGSAGGLLMGAVINMAPYLWKGIVMQVPFVDVVSTMLDETIPLTVGEYDEWGNPNDKKYYDYMLSYSPYDNLRKTHYPSILVTTGYHDSQVQYWEPMKYVAKLRELKKDNNPLLFDCNMDAGHGGGSGRTTHRKEVARYYAFILNLEEINE
jgi:oligopeptidase B